MKILSVSFKEIRLSGQIAVIQMLHSGPKAEINSNTLVFLVNAYFDLHSTDPKSAVFVDFWRRITVYSLWYICYEAYR